MVERGLIFRFKDLLDECELMKTYAKHVLDPTRIGILGEAKGALENIQVSSPTNRTTRWEIPERRGLWTVWSVGESQPNKRSKHRVRGVFSFVWEIRPLDDREWGRRKHFLLDGLASTVIQFVDEVDGAERCLARWTVEVGDHQSPGTHFHVQLNGFEQPPFPKSFDVPRLPGLAMSPFFAIESALGELFQDRWRKHASADNAETRQWRNIHGPRLDRFFRWQADRASSKFVGSPWMSLKTARPEPDLLVKE